MVSVCGFRAVVSFAVIISLMFLSTSIVFRCVQQSQQNRAWRDMSDDDIIEPNHDNDLKENDPVDNGDVTQNGDDGQSAHAGDDTTQKPDETTQDDKKDFPVDDKPREDGDDEEEETDRKYSDDDDDDNKSDKDKKDKKWRKKFGPEGHPMKAMSILSVVLSSLVFGFVIIPSIRAACGCSPVAAKPRLMRWVHAAALVLGVLCTFSFAGMVTLSFANHGKFIQGLQGIVIPHLIGEAFMIIFLFSISGMAKKLLAQSTSTVPTKDCCGSDAECGQAVALTSMVDGVPSVNTDMTAALDAIRRLEAKVEFLTTRLAAQPQFAQPQFPFPQAAQHGGMPPMMYMMPQQQFVQTPMDK